MAEPGNVAITTVRGPYRLVIAQVAATPDDWMVTVSLQHQGGLEKFALVCRLACALAPPVTPGGELDGMLFAQRLGPWLEKNFESLREAALKSIRMEGRLFELPLDTETPGPF